MQRTIRSFVLALDLLVLAAGAVQARPLAVRGSKAALAAARPGHRGGTEG